MARSRRRHYIQNKRKLNLVYKFTQFPAGAAGIIVLYMIQCPGTQTSHFYKYKTKL